VPSTMIASTLVLYIALYIALIVAYIAVIQYMAEKTDDEQETPQSGAAVAAAAGRTA
jgi:cytochrome d ubiquinol oxidase subunit I